MSQIRIRVPLQQYSYIEYDFEGTPEEAIEEVNKMIKLYEISQGEDPGLPTKDFARYKRDILNGSYQLEDDEKANKLQKWFRHEVEKTIQQIKQD